MCSCQLVNVNIPVSKPSGIDDQIPMLVLDEPKEAFEQERIHATRAGPGAESAPFSRCYTGSNRIKVSWVLKVVVLCGMAATVEHTEASRQVSNSLFCRQIIFTQMLSGQ